MVQWTNLQRISRFVNPKQLYITCETSGGLHLAEPGIMAGRLGDKIQVKFKKFKAKLAVD